MKKVLALVVSIMMVLALGCAAFAEEGPVVIGYSSNQSDENENSKMQGFQDYVKEWNEAGNTPKLEAVVTVAEGSIDKQMGDVETMIEMGAKGISLSSIDPEGMTSTAQKCLDAGIDVVEMRGMKLDGIVEFNLCDEKTMAEMAYEWYKKLLDNDPSLVLNMGLIYGAASQTANHVRVTHLIELLKENYADRVNVLAEQYCDWDTQKAMECMENWLQRFPDGQMNCIVAAGAMMACGASNAIVAVGQKSEDWIITATDATADVLYAINEGLVDMTVGIDAYTGGYKLAMVTAQAALDQFTDKYFECGTDVLNTIDATNIADWYTAE
ncbi:MAG: sugar ABC transporter substrate-binding protein [Eubacteriales bacterium]|nr:sugar ABC transporter substrate-binding protein [Eubacteriales bacterium]